MSYSRDIALANILHAQHVPVHARAARDVLMWDNIGTIHNAIGDYTADELRYMRRIQAMATLDYVRLLAEE